jgi:hypothetical protein
MKVKTYLLWLLVLKAALPGRHPALCHGIDFHGRFSHSVLVFPWTLNPPDTTGVEPVIEC